METKLQLGIRMHDMKPGTIEERVAMAEQDGYTCAHIALSKLVTEQKVSDGALTPGYAMYLKRLFARHNIDIAVLGCYLNLATPDEAELKHNLLQYESQLRFASLLGCGVVGTETGAPNTEYCTVPECKSEEALQIFIRNLATVTGYAERMGVLIAIEPVVRHIVYSPERARRVLDEIASPNLRIIFDPVNLLEESNVSERDDIFERAMRLLGQEIAVIHLKDYKMQEGRMIACAPGTGEMDYRRILSFMQQEKPYIHATLEDTVPENAIAAMKYLKQLAGTENL